jgi:putative ABC transport system ATP-binding protein
VHSLLELVEIDDKAENFPSQLSGGQKQRVAIARATASRPKIILADEPTGALDSATGRSVLELFHEINEKEGTTIILVTHDSGIGTSCPRCIHILDGQINADIRKSAEEAKLEENRNIEKKAKEENKKAEAEKSMADIKEGAQC